MRKFSNEQFLFFQLLGGSFELTNWCYQVSRISPKTGSYAVKVVASHFKIKNKAVEFHIEFHKLKNFLFEHKEIFKWTISVFQTAVSEVASLTFQTGFIKKTGSYAVKVLASHFKIKNKAGKTLFNNFRRKINMFLARLSCSPWVVKVMVPSLLNYRAALMWLKNNQFLVPQKQPEQFYLTGFTWLNFLSFNNPSKHIMYYGRYLGEGRR